MSFLRLLVLTASCLQVSLGGWATYRLCCLRGPAVCAVVICAIVVMAGLAGLSGLQIGPRPSSARVATAQLNAIILGLGVAATGVVLMLEHDSGASLYRLELMATLFAWAAAPFLANTIALGLLERRVSRLVV